jgi:osmotically-inducible protein OsmY
VMERTDADIARAARNTLDWNTLIPEDQVTVTVRNGWVTLEGTLDWQYQRMEAENAVRGLTGVKGLSNLITIREQPKPTEIESKIEDALRRHAELDARRIWVETTDGEVILHGNVRSWIERREAEDAAWAAPGVTNVENRIAVSL